MLCVTNFDSLPMSAIGTSSILQRISLDLCTGLNAGRDARRRHLRPVQ
jgi:hypothetical protein